MDVGVDKIKNNFLSKIGDVYNQETYFVKSCYKFPDKYSLEDSITDDHLRIFFEENNYIILKGKNLKYCDKDSKRKIKLLNISEEVGSPDVNIINNYVIEDTWKQIDW